MAQDTTAKSVLKRVFKAIGFIYEDEETEAAARPNRISNASYEEESFAPSERTRNRNAREAEVRTPRQAPRHEQPRPSSGAKKQQMMRRYDDGSERNSRSNMPMGSRTMVYYMHALPECSDVIRDLINGYSIVLNLEETDTAQMQRIVDTLAGASFALGAVIRKVSERTYLIAPKNVNIQTGARYERRY